MPKTAIHAPSGGDVGDHAAVGFNKRGHGPGRGRGRGRGRGGAANGGGRKKVNPLKP